MGEYVTEGSELSFAYQDEIVRYLACSNEQIKDRKGRPFALHAFTQSSSISQLIWSPATTRPSSHPSPTPGSLPSTITFGFVSACRVVLCPAHDPQSGPKLHAGDVVEFCFPELDGCLVVDELPLADPSTPLSAPEEQADGATEKKRGPLAKMQESFMISKQGSAWTPFVNAGKNADGMALACAWWYPLITVAGQRRHRALGFWQVVSHATPQCGYPLSSGDEAHPVALRHVLSQRYLAVDSKGDKKCLVLLNNRQDPRAAFFLHSSTAFAHSAEAGQWSLASSSCTSLTTMLRNQRRLHC